MPEKDKLSSVNLQISKAVHNTLKTFADGKNLKLFEVYNFMAQQFIKFKRDLKVVCTQLK